jgi:hypothetical protein
MALNNGASVTPPARTSFFGNEAFCSTRTTLPAGWTVENKQGDYTKNFTGISKLCRLDFVEVCRTYKGVVPCNSFNKVCVDTPDSINWNDPVYHPEYTSRTVSHPQVCVSKGAFMAPDAAVVFIANVMFSWVILTLGFAAVFKHVGPDRGTTLMKVIAVLMYIPLVLLLFSYYYLNAILGFAALFGSYQLFCRKRAESTAFAFVFLFLALFWVTFENGLGGLQHHSRLRGPNKASDYTYENFCEGYYRSFFTVPAELRGDFDNPAFHSKQYCDRQWLSAELFFMILLELTLLLAALVGGAAIWAPEPVKAENEPAATEMETRA